MYIKIFLIQKRKNIQISSPYLERNKYTDRYPSSREEQNYRKVSLLQRGINIQISSSDPERKKYTE